MPRQHDIEQFKLDLAALSHAAEVLARWGEKPELAPRAAAEIASPSDEGLPPDFAELLDELPIESDRSPKAAPAADAGLDAEIGPIGGKRLAHPLAARGLCGVLASPCRGR